MRRRSIMKLLALAPVALLAQREPLLAQQEPLLAQQEPLGNVFLSNGRKEPFVRISGIAGWPDRLHYFRDLTELKEVLPKESEAPKVPFTEIARIDFLEATPAETKAFGGYWIRKGRIELKGGKKLENVFIGANVDLKGEAGQDWNLYSSKPKAVEFK